LRPFEDAKENIKKLREQANALKQEIADVGVRLDKKRNELMNIADQEARTKALINFGVSAVSALLQVIPYGQPALGALVSGYAKVTAILLAINAMKRQEGEELAVLDHEALLYARTMDQGTRFMLVKYLYFLARCYEYAVLEPMPVNYQPGEIFKKRRHGSKGRISARRLPSQEEIDRFFSKDFNEYRESLTKLLAAERQKLQRGWSS
jgi:hypothetical protein